MFKFLIAAGLILAGNGVLATETVKVTVGHMCCGGCKAAATAGVKTTDWVENVAIEGDVLTITAKSDQKANLVPLLAALDKSGFPARQIEAGGPVTLTIAHLCCPGCVGDLKTKIGNIRSQALDKQNVEIDATAKTVTVRPVAGQKLNVPAILRQFANAGFSASAVYIVQTDKTAKK